MSPDWKKIGNKTIDKGAPYVDKIGGKANSLAQKLGADAFFPVTGDSPQQLEKTLRILRSFLEEGVPKKVETEDSKDDQKEFNDKDQDNHEDTDTSDKKEKRSKRKQLKSLVKIPYDMIRSAKGIVVYTSIRTGVGSLATSTGGGVVIKHNEEGTWSPPAMIAPIHIGTGVMVGLDIYDSVLVLRTQKALEEFYSNKVALTSALGVSAGPYGAGVIVARGKDIVPVWSYVRSKGFYAGIEVLGTVFVSRTDEMRQFYNKAGVTSKDVLTGQVSMPHEAQELMAYLDAVDGRGVSSFQNGLQLHDAHYNINRIKESPSLQNNTPSISTHPQGEPLDEANVQNQQNVENGKKHPSIRRLPDYRSPRDV